MLLIRNSDSMLSPDSAVRFKGVKEVFVYSLIKEVGEDHSEAHSNECNNEKFVTAHVHGTGPHDGDGRNDKSKSFRFEHN